MIVEYDESGRIFHVVSDPVPPGMIDLLVQKGGLFLDLPPTPWPLEPALDADGVPVMIHATDAEGTPIYQPVLDLGGDQVYEVVVSPDSGLPESRPLMEPVMVQAMESNGMDFAEVDIQTDYVVDGAVAPRPVLDLPDEVQISADGVDEAVLSGLPTPCRVLVDGEEHTVEDGELVLTADLPTEYVVVVDQWPHMTHTTRIVAS